MLFREQRITARRKYLTVHVYTCTVSHMKLLSLPCYCATLRQAARAATVLYEDMLAGSGLHSTQFTALQLIESAPNLTTTELAEGLGVDQTTATRTLALIKKAGFASDSVGQDRRQRHWALTAQGQALMKRLKPRWDAAQAAFEQRLGRGEATALKQTSHFAATRLHSV
jgi:DNA-binding MarR family transcriptional regulator